MISEHVLRMHRYIQPGVEEGESPFPWVPLLHLSLPLHLLVYYTEHD